MLTKTELLERLRVGGVEFDLVDHQPALTVEAQVQALSYSAPGSIIKNLFLKVRPFTGLEVLMCCCMTDGHGEKVPHALFRYSISIINISDDQMQDKKDRLYMISALSSTKIDLKGGHGQGGKTSSATAPLCDI